MPYIRAKSNLPVLHRTVLRNNLVGLWGNVPAPIQSQCRISLQNDLVGLWGNVPAPPRRVASEQSAHSVRTNRTHQREGRAPARPEDPERPTTSPTQYAMRRVGAGISRAKPILNCPNPNCRVSLLSDFASERSGGTLGQCTRAASARGVQTNRRIVFEQTVPANGRVTFPRDRKTQNTPLPASLQYATRRGGAGTSRAKPILNCPNPNCRISLLSDFTSERSAGTLGQCTRAALGAWRTNIRRVVSEQTVPANGRVALLRDRKTPSTPSPAPPSTPRAEAARVLRAPSQPNCRISLLSDFASERSSETLGQCTRAASARGVQTIDA